MECNEDFGIIENTKKYLWCEFVPVDWISAMSIAYQKFRLKMLEKISFPLRIRIKI